MCVRTYGVKIPTYTYMHADYINTPTHTYMQAYYINTPTHMRSFTRAIPMQVPIISRHYFLI